MRSRHLRAPILAAIIAITAPALAHASTWQGGTSTWSDPAGWDLGIPDTAAESAIIAAGQVTLDSSPTIGGLTLSGGTILGAGQTLDVSGLFTWSNGSLAGISGQPDNTLNALAGMTIDTTAAANGSISNWTLNLSGSSTVSGNAFNARTVAAVNVNADSTLTVNGTRLNFSTLTNNGTVNATLPGGGTLWGNFINTAGARFEATGGGSLSAGSANSIFAGTVAVSGGGRLGLGGLLDNTTFEFGVGANQTITPYNVTPKGTLTSTGTGAGEVIMELFTVAAGQTATMNFMAAAPVKFTGEFRGGGTVINAGNLKTTTLTIKAGGTLINNNTANLSDRLVLEGDGTTAARFTNTATATIRDVSLQGGALLENSGTLNVNGGAFIEPQTTGSGTVKNSGTIQNIAAGNATISGLQGLAGAAYIADNNFMTLTGTTMTGTITARNAATMALRAFSYTDTTFNVTGNSKVLINQTLTNNYNNTLQGNFSSTGDSTGSVDWTLSNATVPLNASLTLNFSAAAPLVIKNYLSASGSLTVLGTVTNNGTINWNAQAITGNAFTNSNTGIINIRTAADQFTTGQAIGTATFTNDGAVNHYFDSIKANDNTHITNNGTWGFRSTGSAYLTSGVNTRFTNNGTLEQTGTGVGIINLPVDNAPTATIRATAGIFSLGGGGNLQGDVIADGGFVTIASSPNFQLVNTKFTVKNGGRFQFNSQAGSTLTGTLTSSGDGTGFVGTNVLPYVAIVASPFFWSAPNQNAVLNFSTNARFYFHHAAIGGKDGGSITNIGAFEWGTGGVIMNGGLTNNSNNFTISGNVESFCSCGNNFIAHTVGNSGFTNYGTVTHKDSGYIGFRTNTPINNYGTWDITGDADLKNYVDAGGTQFGGSFNNKLGATFRKSGAGQTDIDVAFNNAGTIEINNGTINFASLNFLGGSVRINGGTLNAPGGISLTSGVLSGYGTITAGVSAGQATIAPSAETGSNLVIGSPTIKTGTLTLASLATSSTTTLTFNLNGAGAAGTSDRIKITNTNGLTFAPGTTITIAQSTSDSASLGYYKIFQHNGYTGSLAALNLPASQGNIVYTLDPAHDPGFIDLHKGYLGDANDDGIVNFSDFVVLSNSFGQSNSGWLGADFNNDGTTNFADFVVLSNHFGESLGGGSYTATADELSQMNAFASGAIAVPEPAALAILGLGAAVLVARRRR